ncbi:MAG TPA: hypothetical protein EYH11_07170 [Sulfurimonas autotrophica]|nr:hypothetical protein [Sulfurimonas autotrophica]
MKTLCLLFITTQLFSDSLAWVDEQIEAIKPMRVGVSEEEISKIKNPFLVFHEDTNLKNSQAPIKIHSTTLHVKHKKSSKTQPTNFRLDAIINKSAMIQGKWHKEGGYVYGYKLAKVSRKSVLLTQKNSKILLSTKSSSRKITINKK